jgi:cytochrome c5
MKALYIGFIAMTGLLGATAGHAATAEETYKAVCSVCHDAGVAGAPKFGDKAAWAPRIQQGKDALYNSALNGKPGTAMMAKGGSAKLTEAEVKSVVDLMMAKAK